VSLTIRSAFEIQAPRAAAWAVLTDIERAAPCFPGASLTGRRDDGRWQGAFAVKLGPMAFKFAGQFGFVELDEAAGRATVDANGTDAKGRGGAHARVLMALLPAAVPGATRVQLTSDVDLSGGVAQYGRGAGMIEALSQQLVDQFARNLAGVIAQASAAPEAPAPVPVSPALPASSVSLAPPSPPPAAAPLNAGSLLWKTLLATLRRWLGVRPSA
jgi:carbon monoxide dehydrogenase subunit G